MGFGRFVWLVLLVCFSLCLSSTQGYRFYVGGRDGWVLNPSENYIDWAGRNRFQVNDTLYFKYKGSDSVLVVNKDDYLKCNTKNPIQKLDGGDSEFTFDRSGPFYFISGQNGNCDKGQKLFLTVLAVRHHKQPSPPLPITPSLSPSTPPTHSSPAPSPSTPKSPSPQPQPQQPVGPVSPKPPSPSPSSVTNPPATSPSPLASSPSPSTSTSTSPASSPQPQQPVGPVSPKPSSPSPVANPPGTSPSPWSSSSPSTSPVPAPSTNTPSTSPVLAPSSPLAPPTLSPPSPPTPTPSAGPAGPTVPGTVTSPPPGSADSTAPAPAKNGATAPSGVLASSWVVVLLTVALMSSFVQGGAF